jgi:hypothetical protein
MTHALLPQITSAGFAAAFVDLLEFGIDDVRLTLSTPALSTPAGSGGGI